MLLRVTDLDAGYGRKNVLRGIGLAVGGREIVAVLGHNGAGKSTLMNAIFGLIRPSAGRVEFEGKDIAGRRPSLNIRNGLGYAPQGAEVFKTMTVVENLTVGGFALADRNIVPVNVARVLETFPALQARRHARAGSLSGGERQMLSMGMMLVAEPRLVILDEPSGGLSPLMVETLYAAIRDVAEKLGASVLLVEQDAKHALGIAHRAYVLANGRVAFEGSASALAQSADLASLLVGG